MAPIHDRLAYVLPAGNDWRGECQLDDDSIIGGWIPKVSHANVGGAQWVIRRTSRGNQCGYRWAECRRDVATVSHTCRPLFAVCNIQGSQEAARRVRERGWQSSKDPAAEHLLCKSFGSAAQTI